MADNFLEEYQANKDQEAMAGLDKLIAKERLTSKLAAGEDGSWSTKIYKTVRHGTKNF